MTLEDLLEKMQQDMELEKNKAEAIEKGQRDKAEKLMMKMWEVQKDMHEAMKKMDLIMEDI